MVIFGRDFKSTLFFTNYIISARIMTSTAVIETTGLVGRTWKQLYLMATEIHTTENIDYYKYGMVFLQINFMLFTLS
jgi:hypothetical protein